LKIVRFIAPAIIIAVFAFLLGQLLGYTSIRMPSDLKDAMYNIPLLGIAVVYYVSPLRHFANSRFYRRVNENIRSRMVAIAGVADKPDKFTWTKVKNIFYNIIDHDESLTKRSESILFNGAIWTTVADVTALSVLFALLSALLWWLGFDGAPTTFVLFVLLALFSTALQVAVTRKHISMGDDQLGQIEQYHKSQVATEISALDV
jgi:hypothetical protein